MTHYVHLPEGADQHNGHGVKAQWEERTIGHRGRDVLFLVTDAVIDTVCCGDRVFHYATVLGYVTDWKSSHTDSGQPISNVEPIIDETAQREIEDLLKSEDQDIQVTFRS